MRRIELPKAQDPGGRLDAGLEDQKMPRCLLSPSSGEVRSRHIAEQPGILSLQTELTALLRQSIPHIVASIPPGMSVVSIGIESVEAERILIEELIPKGVSAYYPVDLSEELLDLVLERVRDLPLEKIGLVGSFEDLPALSKCWRPPVLLCMLGNMFCNYERDYILSTLHENLRPCDLFLFDCHLFCPSDDRNAIRNEMEQLYRSEKPAFLSIAPLRGDAVEAQDCEFELDCQPSQTVMGTVYKTRRTIRARKDSAFACGSNVVTLKAGDSLELGVIYEYRFDQIGSFLKQHQFDALKLFLTKDRANLLALAQKQDTQPNDTRLPLDKWATAHLSYRNDASGIGNRLHSVAQNQDIPHMVEKS
jgi:hypothetical protein